MKRFFISTTIAISTIVVLATAYAVTNAGYYTGYTFSENMTDIFCHWGHTWRAIVATPVVTGLICAFLSYLEYDEKMAQKRYDENVNI